MTTIKTRIARTFVVLISATALVTTTATPSVNAIAKTKYVYVTETGKKYHSTKGCRGLNRARSVTKVKEKTAKNRGLIKM